jgi:hypothetical protein
MRDSNDDEVQDVNVKYCTGSLLGPQSTGRRWSFVTMVHRLSMSMTLAFSMSPAESDVVSFARVRQPQTIRTVEEESLITSSLIKALLIQ